MISFNGIKTLFKALSGKKYRKNPHAPALNESVRLGLRAGLINSEQVMAFSDSLTTGLGKDRVSEGLSSAWSIESREDALNTLKWLKDGGHQAIYALAYPIFVSENPQTWQSDVATAIGSSARYAGASEEVRQETQGRAIEMIANLDSVYRVIGDSVTPQYLPAHYAAGIAAWDLGRLVTVARLSFDAGFIDADECGEYVHFAGVETAKRFAAWPKFAMSYIIGRAVWGGNNMSLQGIIAIADDLSKDADSPWVIAKGPSLSL